MDVVLIFNGSIKDKELETRLKKATSTISDLLETECIMKKVEPWNSVRVTFNVPRDAANRLKQLAQRNNEQLKRLGILSIQVEGEDIVRLSVCQSGGNVQQVLVRQQSTPLPRGKVVVEQESPSSNPHDRIQGNGPHELDTILSQLTSGQIQPRLVTQDSPAFAGPAFIVPKQQKKRNRKSKDKPVSTSIHQKLNDAIQSNSVNLNGPMNAHNTMNTNSQVSIATRTSDQSDNLPLSEIPQLDLAELIGADDGGDGPLDLENLGEDKSQYMSQSYSQPQLSPSVEEMVTDMWQNNSINQEVHLATSLSMSTSSLTTNQSQTRISGTRSNNIQQQLPDTSLIEKDSNSNEVDDLLNLQLNSFESEDGSSSILSSNISDIPYSQDAFASISGQSPITTHVIHRQMSFPQYSSKPGTPLGVNSQGMFTQSSGRQSVGPINTATIMSSPHHAQQLMQNSPMGPGDPNQQGMAMHQINQKPTVQQQMHMAGKMFHGSQMVEKAEMPVGNRVITGFGGQAGQNHMDVMGMTNIHPGRQGQNMPVQISGSSWNNSKVGPNSGIMPNQLDYKQMSQQMPHNAVLHSSAMSHKPGLQVGSYTSSSVVTKRGYASLSGSQYPFSSMQNHPLQGMNQAATGLDDKLQQGQQQGMSMASPLLVTLLQTESSCSTTGTSTSAGQTMSSAMIHSAATSAIEPPKPKRKKTPRRKKVKPTYTPPISDSTMTSMIVGQGGMMPGQMAQMSPQHGPNPRLQPAGFNANVGFAMQQAVSPGQYYHPRGQSPLMHQGMGEGPKGMYGHFQNGNNLSPGIHSMGKASPNHMFSPEQKTAYIETINRSDVGSRLANTPNQINQQPLVGVGVKSQMHSSMSPGHNLMTPNHMPASSMNTGTFMGSVSASGTIHHGARLMAHNGMPSPQMQSRMQMSPGVRIQTQGHMPQQMAGGNNLRLGGSAPNPGMQMMGQQYPMHHQQQQYPPQQTSQNISPFQSPPNLQPNSLSTYNPLKQKQQQHNMLISPQSAIMSGELVQDGNMIPPNVVINGSDNLQQAMAVHRNVPGHQKRVGAELTGMMPNDLTMQNTAMYYQQQSSNSPGTLMGSNQMKIPGNPNAAYYHGSMAMAGPNNFNNSSNNSGQSLNPHIPGSGDLLPTLSTALCIKPEDTVNAGATHYATSGRNTFGVLSTGETSILLKGPCTLQTIAKSPGSAKSSSSDTQPVESSGQKSRQCRKSPGSATDGHSSSPGSGHSYPSPAALKKNITPVGTPQTSSASNPLTPSHEPLGSPTSSSIHSGSRSATPKPRSRCTTPRSGCATPIPNLGSNRRLSVERQQHGAYPIHPQSRHPGATTPNSVPVNGPTQLSRPMSRTDQQQFMSSPGNQMHQQYPQNPPPYSSFSSQPPLRPHCSSNTSPSPTNPCQVGYNTQSYGYPPPLAPAHNRDHTNMYQNPFNQQKAVPAKVSAHMGPKSHWGGPTVLNHHTSPNQINMLPNYEPQHDINQMQSQQPSQMHFNPQPPNSILLHHSTNHSSLGVNMGQNDSVNHFSNAYLSESQQSEIVLGQGKDLGITARCTKPSPHFFNSQNQDLLNSGKQQQQQQETSVPLHS